MSKENFLDKCVICDESELEFTEITPETYDPAKFTLTVDGVTLEDGWDIEDFITTPLTSFATVEEGISVFFTLDDGNTRRCVVVEDGLLHNKFMDISELDLKESPYKVTYIGGVANVNIPIVEDGELVYE